VEGTGDGRSIGVDVTRQITPLLGFDTQAAQAALEEKV
jgi:hypothetical protein